MPQLNYSLALNAIVCDFQHKKTTWEELSALLSAPPAIAENRDTWATNAVTTHSHTFFCPSHFRPFDDPNVDLNRFGYRRSNKNVLGKNILILDIDNDPSKGCPEFTIDDAIRTFSENEYLIYTTYNHLNPAKERKEKFRIVFPLSSYCTADEWASIKFSLKKNWPFADPASFTISQGFFLPVTHPDRQHEYQLLTNNGKWLDIHSSIKSAQRPTKNTRKTPQISTQNPSEESFRLHNGETVLAIDLFNRLDDGYENRVACFALSRSDKKPDCFIYRHGNSLCLFDNASEGITRFQMSPAPFEGETDNQIIIDFVAKHKKSKPLQAVVPTPTLIEYEERSAVIRLDSRYLSDFPKNSLPNQGMVFIKSPKGTGKTELMKQFVNEAGSRVLLIGHRVSLLSSLAERLNLINYQDTTSVPDRLAISLDSLTRLSANQNSIAKPYDTIFIDESEQVLRHLTSDTLKKRRNDVFSTLIRLIRGAKRVVCLDADLSYELSIDVLIMLRGRDLLKSDELIGYLNEFRYSDRDIDIYPTRQHLLADLLALIENNERAFVATNGREFAEKLDVIIKQRRPDAKVILISSRTRDFSEVRNFYSNPTTEAAKYDFVITTPSMGTGTSIDTKNHFNAVYGFFSQRPSTFQDCDQAISRVREALPTKVWIQTSTNSRPPRTEQYHYEMAITREKATRIRLPDELPEFTRGEWLWFEIYARLSFLEESWLHQKRDCFIELKEDSGFTVSQIPYCPDSHANGDAAIAAADHDATLLEVQAIIAATDIDQEDADSIAKKQVKTRDEELSLNKFFIKKLLGTLPFDFPNVYQAYVKKLSEKRKRVKQALSPIQSLELEDKDERIYSKQAVTDHAHRTKQTERFNELCSAAQINFRELLSQANKMTQAIKKLDAVNKEYEPRSTARRTAKATFDNETADIDLSISKEQLLAIATHYAKNLNDYNLFFGCRIKDPTKEENQMKAWNATFGYFGVPLRKLKKGPRGAQVMVYRIDFENNPLFFELAKDLIANQFS